MEDDIEELLNAIRYQEQKERDAATMTTEQFLLEYGINDEYYDEEEYY